MCIGEKEKNQAEKGNSVVQKKGKRGNKKQVYLLHVSQNSLYLLDEPSIEQRLVVFTEIGTKKLQFSFVDDADDDVNTKLS